jgi:hypothetical protein
MCIFRVRILENMEMGVHIKVINMTVDCSPQDPSSMLGKTYVKFVPQE